jgi:DNA-binding PadR family transcriptional regulator
MRAAETIPGAGSRLGPGTLYRSMQRMLVDGFIVEITDVANEEDERRRRYTLTRLGHSVAQAEAARLAALVDAASARGLLGGRSSRSGRPRTPAAKGG